MVTEISDVNFDDPYFKWSSVYSEDLATCNLHMHIFSQGSIDNARAKNMISRTVFDDIDKKTVCISRTGCAGGGEAKFTVEWGGSEGPSISGSASGSIRDDHGNKASAEVKVNSDGSGSASVSISHND